MTASVRVADLSPGSRTEEHRFFSGLSTNVYMHSAWWLATARWLVGALAGGVPATAS